MFKDSISIETILEIFVSGGIVVIGAWYLNRAVLFEYFPNIARDVDVVQMANSSLDGKAVVFLIFVLFVGIIITHMFDAILPLVIDNKRIRSANASKWKRAISGVFAVFYAPLLADPRVSAIDRYLASERREWFLKMIREWAKAEEWELVTDEQKIIAHQHVVSRLRVIGEDARKVLFDSYQPLAFAGSIFIALLLLIPINASAFVTQLLVDSKQFKVYSNLQLFSFMTTIWLLSWCACYSLKRRAKTFYTQALTVAMHVYDVANMASPNHSPQARRP